MKIVDTRPDPMPVIVALYVVRAGKTFQVNATNSFTETIFATPALDGNLLIVRTRGHLIALGTI